MTACPICTADYEKRSMRHVACSPICMAELIRQRARKKAERAEIRRRRESLKTLSQWLDEAQQAFNAWIRERDMGQPCISCGRHHQGKWNAGHYRTRAAAPQLRFHPDNVHLQCEPCNSSKAGNVVEYRINLVRKIGISRVEWLENCNEQARYRVDDAKRIKAEYKAKLRELLLTRELMAA